MSDQAVTLPVHELSSLEVQAIWEQACEEIRPQLTTAVFNTWIATNPMTGLKLVGENQAVATITSPTAFHANSIKKNLHDQLKTLLDKIVGKDITLEIKIGSPFTQAAQTISVVSEQPQSPTQPASAPQAGLSPLFGTPIVTTQPQPETSAPAFTPPPFTQPPAPLASSRSASPNSRPLSPRVEELFSQHTLQTVALDRAVVYARQIGLRPDYTFETFAVSTTNEMAHAAATAVSNQPGSTYNPLFLYGGVGVGKTHLMHAIGNNILKNAPDTKILYCTGEEFTNEIVSAIQMKKAIKFKERYRTAQVLLIDDIQFIAGKNAVQEEFFHTFNALTKQASQIVLTSDRPPHEINLIEDRLKSRFEAGLMIDIQQPTFELRTAILLIKSSALNITIPMDLAQLIASKVDSARKIEGIITSIRSEVELKKRPIDLSLIEEILHSEIDKKRPVLKVTPIDVLRAVANHFHVKQAALKGHQRVQELVKARHVAMYLLKEDLHLPLVEIGKWFSNRDHTSVLHASRKIEKELTQDELMQRDISALRMSLTAISR